MYHDDEKNYLGLICSVFIIKAAIVNILYE